MNQNDYIALGLSALVVGGLAVFGKQLGGQPPATPEPKPPPGVNPIPNQPFPPPTPGTDPQYDAARRAIDFVFATLQGQGGGTPAQREAAAQELDRQADTLEASRQSPQAVALLRQAAVQLRSGGQLPVPPPNPAPAPGPFGPIPPIPPFVNPFQPPGTAGTGEAAPSTPSPDLAARYTELRNHCADYLQGARTIDSATLGAADRTSTDLMNAGDTQRAADLGALATASYTRAGMTRPVATNVR